MTNQFLTALEAIAHRDGYSSGAEYLARWKENMQIEIKQGVELACLLQAFELSSQDRIDAFIAWQHNSGNITGLRKLLSDFGLANEADAIHEMAWK